MLFSTHIVAGAVLGGLLRRPALVAPVAVASHLAMDLVPHWGNPDEAAFLRAARVDGLAALALGVGLLLRAPGPRRVAVLTGMAGAGLLDLDKPGRHFFGISPFPRAVDDFHARIQEGVEAPERVWVDLLSALALGAVFLRQHGR